MGIRALRNEDVVNVLNANYNTTFPTNDTLTNRVKLLFRLGPQEIDRRLTNLHNCLQNRVDFTLRIKDFFRKAIDSPEVQAGGFEQPCLNALRQTILPTMQNIISLSDRLAMSRVFYSIPIFAARTWNWMKHHPIAAASIAIATVATMATRTLSPI